MTRTDLMDTSPRAYNELVRMLRNLTPSQRFQMVIDRVDAGLEMKMLAQERLLSPPQKQE